MRLCERMQGCRWQGCYGFFRAIVGVLLLGLIQANSTSPLHACPAEAPSSLTQPHYNSTIMEDSSVGFMAALVQSFLNTVQPNPFPKDLILKIFRGNNAPRSDKEIVQQVALYLRGFIVCAIIGILYIILMPVVGFFLACCRCCGNCGGKMYQKQTSSVRCRRRFLYCGTFVTTVLIFAGNICMFKSNDNFNVSVDRTPSELNKIMANLSTFITSVHQDVDAMVNQGSKTIQEVTRNLDDVGPQLGSAIQNGIRGNFDAVLNSLWLSNNETLKAVNQLNEVSSSFNQLQSSLDRVQAEFTDVKQKITQTLSKPACIGCSVLKSEMQELTLDTSISNSSLNEIQSEMDEFNKINLPYKITELQDKFNSIPAMVSNDTSDVVENIKQQLNDVKTQLSKITNSPISSALDNVSQTLDNVNGDIDRFMPDVEKYEQIRWKVCVSVCCVVLLAVVCNLLGLGLGPLGLKSNADPTARSGVADCGGTFLMIGAGFSFLFSWLFMIVLLLLFLLGGGTYTLICRPWYNGELLKFIDTPGLIPGLNMTNTSFSDIYSNCGRNQSLWTTLHLNKVTNLNELLNTSEVNFPTYRDKIEQYFMNNNITLANFDLLSPEFEKQFRDFSTMGNEIDATAITKQVNISSTILNSTVDNLDKVADEQTNKDIQRELQNEARNLNQIQSDIETIIQPQIKDLNSSLNSLQSMIAGINSAAGAVLRSVGAAQDFLDTNTSLIIETERRAFMDCQQEYFDVYADWVIRMITQHVGLCAPVAGAVDSAAIILCSYMVHSLNAFWFSLGWCIIFFIPSIIFSIKLAKFYRRMKYSDFRPGTHREKGH